MVTTQVNNAASVQVMIDNGQDQVGAESGIASDEVHVQGRIKDGQLLEQGSHWWWFWFIGGTKVIEQDHTEAALGVDQEDRE